MAELTDELKLNVASEATAAAGSLLTTLFSQEEHGQVATVINFTPYDWKLVDGFGQPVGDTNTEAQWEKAATGFKGYNPTAADLNSGHLHAANYTTFALGGRTGLGNMKYSGGFCFYSAQASLNLFIVIGYGRSNNFGAIKGSDHMAMAFFIDGSEIHGDLSKFNKKVNAAIEDNKGSDFADFQQLKSSFGFSFGAPTTIHFPANGKILGLRVQFTGAKETVFTLEPDD